MKKLFQFCLVVLGWPGLLADLQGGEPERVAVLDFVRADSPGSLDPALVDFSRAVQARLLPDDNWTWVERQEFDRIAREADPGGAGGMDPAAAVRLGHLLRADLVLRGEIAQRPGGAGELRLEVIDLKRAELLAARAVAVTMNSRQKLHPIAAEVAAGSEAARGALAEARERLVQSKDLRVLAPLYFRNTGKSSRLNYLEARLTEAVIKAAVPTEGFRALRFPRAGESGEEASLVLTGLTDTDPDAWQKVADAYVWGTFQEEPAEGAVFDDVPVTITLQIWSGHGDPQELKWQGPVRALGEAETALAAQVLAAARAGATGPAEGAARQRIAAGLRQRTSETARQIGSGGRDFLNAPAGRALYAYGVKLMEVACFFDPLNRELQEERLLLTWSQYNPFKPLDTLRGRWLQTADYGLQARRFARQPTGQLDGAWPAQRAKNLRAFIDLLEQAPWTKGKEVSQEEIHRQRQAVVAQWCAVLVDTQRAVAREKEVPAWYDTRRDEWMNQAEFLRWNNDPIVVRDALEQILPVLEKELGRMLVSDSKADQTRADEWIQVLFSTYGAFGDDSRPIALLNDLWRKYVPSQNGGPGRKSSGGVRPPPPSRSDRAWAPWTNARLSTVPAPPAGQPAFAIPMLAAGVREIDPRFINTYQIHRTESTELFQKNKYARINALAWHAGKLWISETDPIPLPPALGPVNPQGGHYVWSYDPVLRSAELVTTKLGGHSPVRFILPTPDALWLGLEADGLWRWNAADGAVRKYRGEDGLQSLRLHGATQRSAELLFVNGALPDLFISRLSLTDGQWTGLQVPVPPSLTAIMSSAQMAGLVASPQIAVSGEWLCFNSPWMTFYNFSTKQWITNPLDPAGKWVMGGEFVVADESGFWMANGGGDFQEGVVTLFDPEKNKTVEQLRRIRIPGRPTGIAQHGPWLWVITGGSKGNAGLVLIDKRTFAVVGRITGLPGEDFRSLAVSDDRIWLGGAMPPAGTGRDGNEVMLMEVTLAEPRPAAPVATGGQPVDFPVHRAVATGDLDRLEKTLAGRPAVDAAAASGWTALMAAADAGRPDMVTRLLAAGANPNLLSRDGDSALQRAALRGNEETVRLLLERGAQPNLRPSVRLRGLLPVNRPIELAAAEISSTPRQPTNLRAGVTPDGEVVLGWEDRAGDEAFYDVIYKNAHGMRAVVARLPANTVRWVDPVSRDEAELVYAVEAVGKGDTVFPERPEVRITRPAPSSSIVRSRYGLGRDFGSELLPASLLAQPPLATAAAAGHAGVVRLLLEKKADPNQEDAVGGTPLIHAVRNRQYATARLLLAAGARPELSAGTGETAAGLAYQWHEDAAFFEELLMAIPTAGRRKEATQLMIQAATLGRINDIEKLHALGGDLGAHVVLGQPPLAAALQHDQMETALWMLEKQALVFGPRWASGRLQEADERIIMAALRNNRPEVFARLLDLGLKVDQLVEEQPLATTAAKNKSLEVLALLHQRGANLSLRGTAIDMDSRGDGSPASYLTAEEVKRYLGVAAGPAKTWTPPTGISIMQAGPPQFVSTEDPAKIAPNRQLLEASKQGDLSAAMAAMAAGADTESYNQDGQTPLLLAIRARAFDLVRWLVEEGASVNHTSKGGSSPVVFAVETGRWDLVDYLLQAGADINLAGLDGFPPLVYASATGNLPAMQRLLDEGADPNLCARRNGRIESPLARALWSGKTESVNLLLSRGANPKAQPSQYVDATSVGGGIKKQLGPSLLMFAAAGKNLALVRQMIELGQDPKLVSDGGYDALAWAADTGVRDVVEYLLPLSAAKGRALESAESKGHAEIVSLLKSAGYTR